MGTMNKKEAGRLGGYASVATKKEVYLRKRKEYLDNPKRCLKCSAIIPFEKRLKQNYCGHYCAAIGRTYEGKHGPARTTPHCIICDKPHKMSGDLCQEHQVDHDIELGLVSERKTLKKWLIKKRGHRCEVCQNTEWMGHPIPLELHHIDGNASNDLPINLELECPNCHAQTPTAKGKNRGNGRAARGLVRVIPRNKSPSYPQC